MIGLLPRRTCLLEVLLTSIALGLVVSLPIDARADDSGTQFREIRELSFGMIGRPANSTNSFVVNWQNGQVSVSGAGDGFHLGNATNGRYQIRGLPDRAITFSAHVYNFSADGITVDEVHVNGPSNSFSTTLNAGGMLMVRLGGVVTVYPNATVGFHHTDVILIVNYE